MSVESIAETLLEKLKTIAQIETVIGEPIQSGESTVVPVSRISVGMGMAGHTGKGDTASSGGGLRIDPVAFLVLKGDDVKVLPIEKAQSAFSKLADLTPDVINLLIKNLPGKSEKTKENVD
ncbi:MAG: hypothetical protein FWH22_02845 [Fibromonadales bacterium]|nr:hypothetical protein [Fibromonadales bacterium]